MTSNPAWTELHRAVTESTDLGPARAALASGIAVDARTNDQYAATAFHRAAGHGRVTVVGDDDFTTSSLNHASTDQQTIGHARQAQVRPTACDVDRAVAAIFNIPASKFRQRAPGSRSDARLAAVGLQQDLAGEPLSSVAQQFGFTSAQSAGTIASRFRRREQNDLKFDKEVKQVRQLLHERQPITFPH